MLFLVHLRLSTPAALWFSVTAADVPLSNLSSERRARGQEGQEGFGKQHHIHTTHTQTAKQEHSWNTHTDAQTGGHKEAERKGEIDRQRGRMAQRECHLWTTRSQQKSLIWAIYPKEPATVFHHTEIITSETKLQLFRA